MELFFCKGKNAEYLQLLPNKVMKTKPSNIFAVKCSKKIFHCHSLSHYKILFYFSKDLAFRELKSGCTEALGEGNRQRLVLEKTLESSLDCKEIKPVNPKGNQS